MRAAIPAAASASQPRMRLPPPIGASADRRTPASDSIHKLPEKSPGPKKDLPAVGSLYQETDGRHLTWRVEAIIYPVTSVPHVRLVRADDRTTRRTIAVSVLRDGRRLKRIDRSGDIPA